MYLRSKSSEYTLGLHARKNYVVQCLSKNNISLRTVQLCLWQLNHIKDHKPKCNHCKWFRADGNSSIISDEIGMSCYYLLAYIFAFWG